MSWIAAIFTNGLARKALGLIIAAITIVLFLLNLRRAGESAGRLGERLQASKKTHEIQSQMLDAATRRPADHDALADRLRDGRF
jgi:CHASE3 domain sensor protein